MKYALILTLAILTGLAFARIPHHLNTYATVGLPPPYNGPKHRTWTNGTENRPEQP